MIDKRHALILERFSRILDSSTSLTESVVAFEQMLGEIIGQRDASFEDSVYIFDNAERATLQLTARLLRAYLLTPNEIQRALVEIGMLNGQAHQLVTAQAILETEIVAFLSRRAKSFSAQTRLAYAAFIEDWISSDESETAQETSIEDVKREAQEMIDKSFEVSVEKDAQLSAQVAALPAIKIALDESIMKLERNLYLISDASGRPVALWTEQGRRALESEQDDER